MAHCGLRPIRFCQFFGEEASTYVTGQQANFGLTRRREIPFIVQVMEKVQKKAQFSFCGQRKAFHYDIVLRGIQPHLLHGGALDLF